MIDEKLQKWQKKCEKFEQAFGEFYSFMALITGIPVFFGSWIYCIWEYGYLLGVGLGWLPSLIVGFIVGVIWILILFFGIILWFIWIDGGATPVDVYWHLARTIQNLRF